LYRKYIADLTVLLRTTSSQVIKKRGDFREQFWQKSATYRAGVTIDRDLPYKINNKYRLLTNKQKPILSAETVNIRLVSRSATVELHHSG
jgi:hypothetical protein